jgi:hypothetical protein
MRQRQSERISDTLSGSIERFREVLDEIRAGLEAIKICPGPCEDGTVSIRAKSGLSRRAACPVANGRCAYGIRLGAELDAYIARIMARIGVPKRHVENFCARRESYTTTEAAKWPVKGFLVFCGKNGSGKSFGAACVVRGYLENRIADRLDREAWGNADRAGNAVTWRSSKDLAGDSEVCEKAASATLLVIDDLGREEDTKIARPALCSVVSKRYDAKLAAVITTELSMADMRKRYGRYLTDRLTEDAGSGVIDCGDESMRMARCFVPE